MKLLKSNCGKMAMNPAKVGGMITSIILLIVALKVFAKGLPEIGQAGNEVYEGSGNSTHPDGYALTSLFTSDNVLILAIVGGVLIAVILQVLPKSSGK